MKKYKDENWLRQKYCVEMLDGVQMAKLADCNPTTLYKWMDRFGIQRRPKGARIGVLNSGWKGGKAKFICEVCSAEFERYPSAVRERSRVRFCSWGCKLIGMKGEGAANYQGNLVECICKGCGRTFTVSSPSKVKKYCSAECRYRKVVKICEKCGAQFTGPNARFCSMKCRDAVFAGGGNPNHRGGRLVKCKNCGEKVWKKPSELKPNGRLFCSPSCYDEWCVGENHHCWRGGISFEPYPSEFNDRFKCMIRERDGNRCVLCGKTKQEEGRKMCVHHVTYDKDNLNPDLKVSLCRSCHGKTNSNRQFWITVFTRYWRRAPVQDWQMRQVVT
jgi:hypothetical protein